jgi:endonuclease YncB( thermonuclease family)
MHEYEAVVVRVIDGDTLELNVDLGFKTWRIGSFRLAGINAREKSQPGGAEAKAHLVQLLPAGKKLLISSIKVDKYGDRYDCWASFALEEPPGQVQRVSLQSYLVANQWAAWWDGSGERKIPSWPRVIADESNLEEKESTK